MTKVNEISESPATTLCKSCGLCCTGHLFVWTKLRSPELDGIQSLGVDVLREPGQRGFDQPCPLWNGVCTIYTSPQYPRFCRNYKCKLVKQILDEIIPLHSALTVVQQTKSLIHKFETFLPASSNPNFRERLVAYVQEENTKSEVHSKARELLEFYETHFGVSDLVELK